jgi:hypothetical protein
MSFADSSFASAPFSAEGIDNTVVVLTGVSSTIALNNLIISAGGSVIVTAAEDQMDFAIGTVIAEAQSIVSVTGLEAESDVGTATTGIISVIEPTGIEVETNLNNVDIVAGGSVTLTPPADLMDTELGSVVVQANADVVLTGLETEADVGTVSAEAGAIASPSGVSMQFADGDTTETGTALVEPSGLALSVGLNDLTIIAGGNVTVSAPADQMDFAIGSITTTAGAVVELTGLGIQFSDGTAIATGSTLVTPTGIQLTTALGKETIAGAWGPVIPGASNSWTEVAA